MNLVELMFAVGIAVAVHVGEDIVRSVFIEQILEHTWGLAPLEVAYCLNTVLLSMSTCRYLF